MEHANTDWILGLVVLFGLATLVSTIFRKLHIPTLIGFIFSGILLQWWSFEAVDALKHETQFLAELGTILLMFTIGLELNLGSVRSRLLSLFGIGMPQVVISSLVIYLAAKWFGLSTAASLTFGFAGALSSTALIFKMLEESRDSHSETAKRAVPVLIFQDMAVIPMILILTTLTKLGGESGLSQFGWESVATLLFKVFLCIIFVIVGSRHVFPWILEKVSKTGSRELFYFCILFLAMGVGYLAIQLGFSVSLGAFIAGVMISESSWSKKALSEIMSMRDTFLGLFFIAIGLMVNPSMLLDNSLAVVGVAAGVFAVKFIAIVLPCLVLRVPLSIAVALACMLSHMGEFSFIIFNQAYGSGVISEATYQVALGGACISLLFAPGLYYFANKLLKGGFFQKISVADTWHQIQEQTLHSFPIHTEFVPLAGKSKASGSAILIGFGAAGENLGDAFDALDIPFTAIDMSFKFFRPKSKNATIVYGDASKEEILESAGIRTAKLVVITVNSAPMTQAILSTVQHLRPDIHCVVRTQYLLEAKRLQSKHHFQLVVAEYETTLELLAQSLRTFGVSGTKINELLEDCRNRFSSDSLRLGDSLRRNVDTPPLKAMRNIQPMQVEADSEATGQTLKELDIRNLTGATVVAVFNEKKGAIVPGPDYKLCADDTLHLIGDKQAIERAALIFQNPKPVTSVKEKDS